MFILAAFLTAVFAGFFGAIVGLGGGVLIIPMLTLLLKVDIRYAIAASLVSIVASSSGAAASYLQDRLTNLRIGVLLEVGTVTGALIGFLISGYLQSAWLFFMFGIFLMTSAVLTFRRSGDSSAQTNHPWAVRLNLSGSFRDQTGVLQAYNVAAVPLGLSLMFLAGILSALLGIGSGILKILAMDNAMKLPTKVSSATSNFMIGVTATGSAGAYFLRGDVRPEIVGPVTIGIIVGSFFGAKAMIKLPAQTIRKLFVVVLLIVGVQMMYRGWSDL